MPPWIATALFAAVALGLCVVVHWLTKAVERARAELAQAREHMLRYAWLEWWTRNAAETTPLEPARPYMVALSYAAQLAPTLQAFVDACEDLADDISNPEQLRTAARGYVVEWCAPSLPWVTWARDTGKPMHNEHAQALAFKAALAQALELSLCIPTTSSSSADDDVRET